MSTENSIINDVECEPLMDPETRIELLTSLTSIKKEIEIIEGRLTGRLVLRKPKSSPWLKPWLTNKILLISIAWQILGIVLLQIVRRQDDSSYVEATVVPMIIMQIIHLGLVVLTSIKLVKQVLHRTVSPWFLAQSYLSTILLYAGIYTMVWKMLIPKGVILSGQQPPFSGSLVFDNPDFQWCLTWLSFLYFSTATMTTVGYGDISPSTWYTKLIVCSEMLFSIMYSAVILSIGLQHFTGSTYVKKEETDRRANEIYITQPIIDLMVLPKFAPSNVELEDLQ